MSWLKDWFLDVYDAINAAIDDAPPPPPVVPAPPPPPVPPVPPVPATPGAVVVLFNEARAAAGLPPLVEDAKLDLVANLWAQSMALKGVLSHGDFAGRISAAYPGTAAAEDIAEGYPAAEAVVAGWLASPPHRANILGAFTIVGVSSAADIDGTLYWAADFDAA